MVRASRPGFSLVEVIVALTLLSVGVLGVAGSALLASRFMRAAELQEEMVTRASGLLDSLAAVADTGRGVVTLDRYRLTWQASGQLVEVHAAAQDSELFVLRAAR